MKRSPKTSTSRVMARPIRTVWAMLAALFYHATVLASQVQFVQQSSPVGVFTSSTSTPLAGSLVQSVVAPRDAGGYRFSHWIASPAEAIAQCATGSCRDALGQSTPAMSFVIVQDVTLTAVYLSDIGSSFDVDGDGLPDADEFRYFGSLAVAPNDDSDMDGPRLDQELLIEHDPKITDIGFSGGISRTGSSPNLIVTDHNYRIFIQRSNPPGPVPFSSAAAFVRCTDNH